MDKPEDNFFYPQKERVQLDFSPESLQRLDKLKLRLDAGTRGETIRQSLRLLDWFINEIEPDSIIEVTDHNGSIAARFNASLLQDTLRLH